MGDVGGLQMGAPLRVCLVGPLPPPSGGMAGQCQQLLQLTRDIPGLDVVLVQSNAPYSPPWLGRLPYLRALGRMLPFLWRLWRTLGRSDVAHVMANSGWSWHLVARPSLLLARWRHVATIVNYHGGQAEAFFAAAGGGVLSSLACATMRITPSAYLQRVFRKFELDAEIIPNVVDLSRFGFAATRDSGDAPHLIVTRNLEAIYDIPTAVRAFERVRAVFPRARLTIAGSGPERAALEDLVARMGLANCITFAGRIDNASIHRLYQTADCLLNPSTADNMPVSLIEAMACGVPLVSTDVGGIPDLVDDGRTGWLVPVGDDRAMAERVIGLLRDPVTRASVCDAARSHVGAFGVSEVRSSWLDAYRRAAAKRRNR